MLGEEYVKISKISRAAHVFCAGLATLHKPRQGFIVSPAAKAVFLLRYSMYLALEGGVEQRCVSFRSSRPRGAADKVLLCPSTVSPSTETLSRPRATFSTTPSWSAAPV